MKIFSSPEEKKNGGKDRSAFPIDEWPKKVSTGVILGYCDGVAKKYRYIRNHRPKM